MADDNGNGNNGGNGGSVNPIQVQKYLGGLDYPASRQELIDKAKEQGADDNVLNTLKNIPDQEYEDPTEVTEAIGNLD